MPPKAWEGPGGKEEDSSGGKNVWANILFISPQWKLSVGYSMLQQDRLGPEMPVIRKKEVSSVLSKLGLANEVCASGDHEREVWTKSNCILIRS